MRELPQGTVTFLFTDIAGSTRLWQQHRAAMERAYARHDALLREAISAHHGVVYKVIGDAFQVAFPTVPEAVVAALEAQRGLVAEDWATSGLPEPLSIRMALHVGDVDPDPDGNYRSPVLNRLGRLLGAGHGGQILLSAGAALLGRDRLPDGAGLRDLGPHRLKDLLEPEPIWQLLHPELPDAFPPLATLERHAHNLPLQPTPFLGREPQVAQVVALLRRPEVRLLTLTGPGGTGKTRLGLQAAAEVVEDFPDGVFFVDLSPLADPALVPSAMAEALGVREEAGQSLLEGLRESLAGKHLLLVLDNVEHVSEAAPVVGELLRTSSGLKVLSTSRIPLRLRAEQEYAVPPLGLPRRKPPLTLEQLSQYEAVRLFIARAQAVKSTFAIENETAPAIAEICHRLDGLPLAIELAAARIRVLSPQAMLSRLEQRLPLLTGGARDLPARQQTLRQTIAWSYELLSLSEQALFRRLAVFAGGWSLEAAEAVAGSPASGELELDVLEGLERLVAQNLLRQEAEVAGEPRFWLLETIREFGLEQLEADAEAEEARQRHAAFFLELTERAEPTLISGEQSVWLDRLEAEHDNLRAALNWTLDRHSDVALRLAAAAWRFWFARGYVSEGRGWLARALAQADSQATPAYVRALYGAGSLALCARDLAEAAARLNQGLAHAQAIDDEVGVSMMLVGLATLAGYSGEQDRAVALFEEVLTRTRCGDQYWSRVATTNLAVAEVCRGEVERAWVLLEQSLLVDRELGDLLGMMHGLVNLGEIGLLRGEATALQMFQETLTLGRESGHKPMVGLALAGIGRVAALQGQLSEAVRLIAAATGLSDATSIPLDWMRPDEHEQAVDALREQLGETAFSPSWKAGMLLPLDDAIAAALTLAGELAPGAEVPT